MKETLLAWLSLLVGVLLLLWTGAILLGPNPRSVTGESELLEKMTQSKKRMAALIVGVVVVMSLVLIVMVLVLWLWFRVPTWITYILYGIVAAGGVLFVGVQMHLLSRLFKPVWARVAVCVYIPCAALAWFFWPSWLTILLIAVVIVLGGLASLLQITLNFKAVALVGAGLFIYDITNVYFTGLMMRAAEPAIHSEAPMMVVVPQQIEIETAHDQSVPLAAGLGLGDIILPGALIMIAAVLAYRYGAKSVLYGGLTGYAIGLVAVFVILGVTGYPQPALITLYPAVMAGILLTTRRAGLTRELFALRHEQPKPEVAAA